MPIKHVGVDGCDAGWFAVAFAGSEWETTLLPSAFSLWYNHRDASRILVDVPIGLRETEAAPRECDRAARARLSPHRHHSVFPVPCRSAVYEDTYEAAQRVNQRIQGKGLNSYSWGIASRIREFDELLDFTPADKHRIRETHPEVCFWAFNGFEPMEYTKQTEDGFAERKALLTRIDQRSESIIRESMRTYRSEGVSRYDILDALAVGITATSKESDLNTLPSSPESDARGLPMEIVYPTSAAATQRTIGDFAPTR